MNKISSHRLQAIGSLLFFILAILYCNMCANNINSKKETKVYKVTFTKNDISDTVLCNKVVLTKVGIYMITNTYGDTVVVLPTSGWTVEISAESNSNNVTANINKKENH